ncbi:MAG: hypothetical protein LBD59_06335 [Prevotellaceae bacterium]|jgi:hypothetical protein|nr:hypothetical protein [Prevotellaceae bacterium]
MIKTLLSIILTVLFGTALVAQETADKEKYSAFHFGFTYPISTNGLRAYEYNNGASINLLAGISNSEKAFVLGGLGNIVRADINGVAFAGLVNFAGGKTKGLAFAGLTNASMQGSAGVAFAGLLNLNGGETKGLTFAGLTNASMQGSAGVAFAGLVNFNNKASKGLAFAGGMNLTNGAFGGVQFAGLANVARNVSGWQFAGLVNVAKKVKGIQIGGLMNVADSSDYAVGIVNLIGNGEKTVALVYDELGNVTATFRSGGKTLYGIVGAGYGTDGGTSLVTEAGIGANVHLGSKWRLNNDLTSGYILAKRAVHKNSYTLWLAWRASSLIEVAAGTGINYLYTNNPQNINVFPSHSFWKNYTDNKLQQIFAGYKLSLRMRIKQ